MNSHQVHFKKIYKQIDAKGDYKFDFNLSKYTWLGVAGSAEIFYIPDNKEELSAILKNLKGDLSINILGLGSNILIRDGGIKGLVIKLGRNFGSIEENENHINVGSYVPDRILSNYCLKNSYSGFEYLSGIPGSIGGAVYMNAGCYGTEVKDIFLKAYCLDYDGNTRTFENTSDTFSYRKNNIVNNLIVIDADFKKTKGDFQTIENKMKEVVSSKKTSQPEKIRTAGSTFKNPKKSIGKKAWELIEESGLRSFKMNGISLSPKHANFIVNQQFKSSNMIEDFGEVIREKVFNQTGIMLDWEIQIIGDR